MAWYNTLEEKIVPIAFDTAKAISSKVKYAQVEFENGSVSIVIPFHECLSSEEWQKIEDSVRLKLARVVADPDRLKIRLRHEFRSMFSRHLEGTRRTPKVIENLHEILHFPISATSISGLRQIYHDLFNEAAEFDYVATTALGGIPALTFLVRQLEDEKRPSDQNEWEAFYDALREKFHLLPGLNWSGTDDEKTLFFDWISNLPDGSSVLLFDTGTSGNGIREMVNLIRERIEGSLSFGPSRIKAIGVVDGKDSAQRDRDEEYQSPDGKSVRVRLTFKHVPKMLTEDCQRLIGYTSVRRQLMLAPLRSNAVMQIFDENGELVYSCGALGADSLLRSVIQMRQSKGTRDPESTDLMGQIISFAVAYFSIGEEYTMLQNAYEFGLISERQAEGIKERMQEKYAKQMISGGTPEWDFDSKEVRRDGPAES